MTKPIDYGHTAIRATLGSIPALGAAAAELFNVIVVPPLERRRQEWMEQVASKLSEVEQRIGKLEDLRENDAFLDTLLHASRVAIATSSQEKRQALQQAVVHSALPETLDDARRHMFVRFIDDFTPWHLRILRFFDDPIQWFDKADREPPGYYATSLSQVLEDAYSDLKGQLALYDQIVRDLHASGLLSVASLHAPITRAGWTDSRTTDLGKEFLTFIS